jgi:hypothetical protein
LAILTNHWWKFCVFQQNIRLFGVGEPLWLSGKVMEWENKRNQKIPGSLPSPSNLF